MNLATAPVVAGLPRPTRGVPAHSRLYQRRDPVAPPLRVVLVGPARVPAWLGTFVQALATGGWLAPEVVLAPHAAGRVGRPPATLELRAYLALERLRRRGDAGALARVDLASCARRAGVPVRSLDDARAVPEPTDRLVDAVAAGAPDLVLLLGSRETARRLAPCARFGCWRIGGDLADAHTAALVLLPSVLAGRKATPIELELVDREGLRMPLVAGNVATAGSFVLQREQALAKLPMLLRRSLRRLHDGQLPVRAGAATLSLRDRGRGLRAGAGLRALVLSARDALRWRQRLWQGEAPWFVAVRREGALLDPAAPVVGEVAALVAPEGRYWADPCLVSDGGRQLLFVEEFAMEAGMGVIACLELTGEDRARRLGIALAETCHLSYPQVFAAEGAWYMTVESGARRRASLYRASAFPLRWERVADLLEGCHCVDPTLYRHEGRWYLFANISESGPANTSDELFLFVADSLCGPYVPHPANPVVSDVRRSRPAGRLFVRDGRLLRPSQDCTPDYGAAIVFNEVLELSPTAYRERPLSHVDASWMPGLRGCHTYSAASGADVVDACGHPATGTPTLVVDDTPDLAAAAAGEPLVSALVPVYNGERFLAEAIESALAQTLQSVEVVVVDDGSSDASGAIADRYAAAHPDRVRVVHQANAGLPLARNAAMSVARGRYFALLDADDAWLPDHLEHAVAVLERDASVGLVHANSFDIDADGVPLPADDEPRWGADEHDAFAAVLLRRQHVVCPTAVFRRSVVEQVGGFDPAFNRLGCEDRDLWLRIAEVSRLVYLDRMQARYRIHGANMSANSERMWRARRLLADKFAARPSGRSLRRRSLAAIDADRGHELARSPSPMPALAAFARALLRDPLRVDAWKGLVRRILVGPRSDPAASR